MTRRHPFATSSKPDLYDASGRREGAMGANGGRGAAHPVLSPSRMGDVNRSRVLQALCDNGPLSRADLARMAGVPRATISGIVRPLLEGRLLEELPPDRSVSRVGKPGRPLWFRAGAGLSVAVSLRADACEAALVSARGELLERHAAPMSDPADLRAVHRDIVAGVAAVIPSPRPELLGIGVAVPGVCDTSTGAVVGSSQIPSLDQHALGPALTKRLEANVLIDNDSRAQALGEKWFGDGRGIATFAAIQTGHGIGVGLVLGGTIYRGENGRVGEIGHVPVVANGEKCRCGLRGCWETIATLPWLRGRARQAKLPDAKQMDARALTSLAGDGSAAAVRLLEEYSSNLAVGLATLVQLIDPQRLILHGDAVGGGEVLRLMIEARTRALVLPHLRGDVQITLSALDQDASLLGAAGLVLSETFHLTT